LTTDRPYRAALSPEEAFSIMRDEVRKGWWDGQLVEEFKKLIAAARPQVSAFPG
jgi:HD-GYP domain-containing protein (c-di-GMP phosphodiesterase class II)